MKSSVLLVLSCLYPLILLAAFLDESFVPDVINAEKLSELLERIRVEGKGSNQYFRPLEEPKPKEKYPSLEKTGKMQQKEVRKAEIRKKRDKKAKRNNLSLYY